MPLNKFIPIWNYTNPPATTINGPAFSHPSITSIGTWVEGIQNWPMQFVTSKVVPAILGARDELQGRGP